MISMTDEEFEGLVEDGLSAVDPKYQKAVRNVAVVVEPRPNSHHRKVGGVKRGWTLYGLYEGVPLPERGEHYMFTVPDKISIFREPILEVAESVDEAREIVKNTVWHEFAHYFGWDEEEVHAREVLEGRDRF
jgi:predicted Zn-dependent protease with MMP-like domain